MADRFILPPDQMPAYDPAEAARAEAASFLASRAVPGYSAAPPPPPPPMSTAGGELPPAGPPPPPAAAPAPAKPSIGSRIAGGLKDTGIMAAGTILGGPVGAMAAQNYITSKNMPAQPPAPPQAEESYGPEFGPPAPPPPGPDEAPLILGQPGGGQPRMVAPAGMYPQSMTTQAHLGRPVPEETKRAFGAAAGLQIEGADRQFEADRDYYNQVRGAQATRMRATEDAAVAHARIQAERDATVRQRLDEIEQLNAEASAQIDPDKYWTDRGAGARIFGAIAIGLGEFASKMQGGPNTAANLIEAGINREINAQLSNRQQAGQKAARAERLLDLHMARLGDQDKAVDATKLALYDNVLAQMDAYAAENHARVSEASMLATKGAILERRGELVNKLALQETDDVQRSYTEAWRAAQYTGGGGGGTPAGKMDGYELIPVPASDRTSEKNALIAVPKGSHEKLGAVVGATNSLVGINQEALERIQAIKKDIEAAKRGESGAISRIQANRKLLVDLEQRKASALSSAEGQGVLKEAEYQRAVEDRVMFNDWWKPGVDVEKRIQAQNNSLTGAAGRIIQGYGGQRVKMAYTRDKNGALQPTPLFTGQMYTPPAVGPEMDPVRAPKGGK